MPTRAILASAVFVVITLALKELEFFVLLDAWEAFLCGGICGVVAYAVADLVSRGGK